MALGKSGMLGTSRLANGASAAGGPNPARSMASGLMGSASGTDSHVGEILFVVIIELAILALLRKKLRGHHGG